MRLSRFAGFVIVVGLLLVPFCRGAGPNAWYWDSPVNIHWDNHGGPLGQGMTPTEIAKLFEGLDVDAVSWDPLADCLAVPRRFLAETR